jgi:hypothetical protein
MPDEPKTTGEKLPFTMASASVSVAHQTEVDAVLNNDLYAYAIENKAKLMALIHAEITEKLGEKFRIGELRIDSGSAIVSFDVLTEHVKQFTENGWVLAGVTFAAIDGFLNMMDRLATGVSTVLRFFFQKAPPNKVAPGPIIVQPVWHPSADLLVAIVNMSSPKRGADKVLIRYLIFSHAILTLLLGFVVAHFMHWIP